MTEKNLSDNQKQLAAAQAGAKAFEAELEVERLREAFAALERINLSQEPDPASRALMRAATLKTWLSLVALIDAKLDPAFNPDDVPSTTVMPPRTAKGAQYPPGASPALIDDPKARAEYEKAIEANRQKAENYRLQINLRKLNERLPPKAEAFIRANYKPTQFDKAEVAAAVEKILLNPERKEKFLKILDEPGK